MVSPLHPYLIALLIVLVILIFLVHTALTLAILVFVPKPPNFLFVLKTHHYLHHQWEEKRAERGMSLRPKSLRIVVQELFLHLLSHTCSLIITHTRVIEPINRYLFDINRLIGFTSVPALVLSAIDTMKMFSMRAINYFVSQAKLTTLFGIVYELPPQFDAPVQLSQLLDMIDNRGNRI